MNFAFSNKIYEYASIYPATIPFNTYIYILNFIDFFVNVCNDLAQTTSTYESSMYMYMHLYDYASLDGPCVTVHVVHARNNFLCHQIILLVSSSVCLD